jgi:hypothetical protein
MTLISHISNIKFRRNKVNIEQIGMLVITSIIGIATYYFKKNSDRLDREDDYLHNKIENLQKELSDHKIEVERNFVSKDEFIRSISNFDKKLDKIYDEILKSANNN